MGFPSQEYWNGLPFPSFFFFFFFCHFLLQGDLPNPGIKPASLVSPALAGGFFTAVPLGSPKMEQVGF